MEKNICVIITSVIYFKDKRLSYSLSRSSFSPNTRLEQTIVTINSIRKKIPNAKIYLFEQGINNDVRRDLEPLVNNYVYLGDNPIVRIATDSIFKGVGEVVGLLTACRYLPKNTERYFKISGRYYLNNDFDLSKWENGDIIVRKYNKDISTRFYSFTSKVFNIWKRSLIFSIPFLFLNKCVEHTMPIFIPDKYFKNVGLIGVSGLGAAFADEQKD